MLPPLPWGELHPLIQGLFLALPSPGMRFAAEERQRWLATAEGAFGLLYDEPAAPTAGAAAGEGVTGGS